MNEPVEPAMPNISPFSRIVSTESEHHRGQGNLNTLDRDSQHIFADNRTDSDIFSRGIRLRICTHWAEDSPIFRGVDGQNWSRTVSLYRLCVSGF